MSDESVKVAVRVRPFNQREIDRNAKLTVNMKGNMTIITNPENSADKKNFTFDYSYWSHDGCIEDKDGVLISNSIDSRYASQKTVFEDLGQSVLKNAFEGYNCSLFAYGQTGSGKSYSMIGYGPNKGIVPVICDELFKKMLTEKKDTLRYEVSLSMLEIYNENIRDLLTKESHPKGGLPIRQTPYQGFYVQGLKKVPVGSYNEIESRMDQGTSNRTVAMTNMNATSSRAHTVVIITFDQITHTNNTDTRKSSVMNLVDLAGSERADSTGATGDRLKEGANINKSLSVLGNVISALADASNGKKKIVVPYRDSVLTKLLQNALGGNSKTVMIAALSPADINYDETLSTLRYADRAKQIKNKAFINENPMDKILRELKEENEKLKLALNSGNLPQIVNTQGLTQEEIAALRLEITEEIKAQLTANTEIIEAEDPRKWKVKLEEARKEVAIIAKEEKIEAEKKDKVPHLINLNEDPQLSGVILHYLESSKTLITRLSNDEDSSDEDSSFHNVKRKTKSKLKSKKNENNLEKITLKGLSISNRHAIIERKSNNKFTIRPGLYGAQTKLNGNVLSTEISLKHKDRVLFGSHHLYLFINPTNSTQDNNLPKLIDWEFAQSEIAHIDGFETQNIQGMTNDQQIVQQQILEIIPMVSEVNAISEELKKYKTFDIVLVPPNSQDSIFGTVKRTCLMIKITDSKSGNTWYWERGKFMNRRFLMQELYQQFLEDGSIKPIQNNKDPFWEPLEELIFGTANVFLQSLAYNLDFDDKIPILNYGGQEEGFIFISISPSTVNGRILNEDNFVDNPKLLLTRTFHFLVTVASVSLHNSKYKDGIRVRYRVFKDDKCVETELIKNTINPIFNHNKVFSFARIVQEHLDYFDQGYITFRVYINQEEVNHTNNISIPKNPIVMPKMEKRRLSVMPVPELSDEHSRLKSELSILNKKLERLEQKDLRLKNICNDFNASEENANYEGFYKAVKAVLFSGSKFKSTSRIINQIASYGRSNKIETKNGINGNTFLPETIPEEEDNYPIKRPVTSARSDDSNTSKACSIM